MQEIIDERSYITVKKCKICGAPLPLDAKYCWRCGAYQED